MYHVQTADALYFCYARGLFRNKKGRDKKPVTPLVGDRVTVLVENEAEKTGTVQSIEPRTNEMIRPAMANIDQVIVTVSAAQPAFNPGLLDRFLVLAAHAGIPAVICVSKADLLEEKDKTLERSPKPRKEDKPSLTTHEETATSAVSGGFAQDNRVALSSGVEGDRVPLAGSGAEAPGSGFSAFKDDDRFKPYIMAGYELIFVSTVTTTGDLLAPLRRAMAGKLSVFAGPSGVGKSSIINALLPHAQLETGEISAKLKRGKHTTRAAEILPLGNDPAAGYVADTPGFSSLDTDDIPPRALANCFVEFATFAPLCKFNDCLHGLHNREADCAVRAQVGQAIHPARYAGYLELMKRR